MAGNRLDLEPVEKLEWWDVGWWDSGGILLEFRQGFPNFWIFGVAGQRFAQHQPGFFVSRLAE